MVASLVLIPCLATRWCKLYLGGKGVHEQVQPLQEEIISAFLNFRFAIFLEIGFVFHMHSDLFQIGSNSGHQVESLALLGSKVGHQLCHLHCQIALECPIGIISWYSVGIFNSQSHIS